MEPQGVLQMKNGLVGWWGRGVVLDMPRAKLRVKQ